MLKRMWSRFRGWPLWVQILIGLVLLFILIPTSDDDQTEEQPVAVQTAADAQDSPEPSPSPEEESDDPPGDAVEDSGPGAECIPVSKSLLSAIETGLTVDGGSLRSKAFAVRSSDFEKVWMVAAELDAPGLQSLGDVAVWATNGDPRKPGGTGLIIRANGIAEEFSDWGEAAQPGSSADFSAADQGVAEATRCVEAAFGG